jgi:hypothetical protein
MQLGRELKLKNKDFNSSLRNLSTSERIRIGKEKVSKLTERVLDAVNLSAVCDHFLYSNTLSSQIPRSYAGHAFAATQQALFQQLIIRTVALWDKPDFNVFSIPTAIALIDDDAVIHQLQNEHFQAHSGRGSRNLNPSHDPEIGAEIQTMIKNYQTQFATSQANKADKILRVSIDKVKEVTADRIHLSIVNLRDHVSHSLDQTRRELKEPVANMKYGQEKDLLQTSVRLIENLYCWVNGTSFDIQGDCASQAKRNASELWTNCTFNIPAH